jgi:hypothetical protein
MIDAYTSGDRTPLASSPFTILAAGGEPVTVAAAGAATVGLAVLVCASRSGIATSAAQFNPGRGD